VVVGCAGMTGTGSEKMRLLKKEPKDQREREREEDQKGAGLKRGTGCVLIWEIKSISSATTGVGGFEATVKLAWLPLLSVRSGVLSVFSRRSLEDEEEEEDEDDEGEEDPFEDDLCCWCPCCCCWCCCC